MLRDRIIVSQNGYMIFFMNDDELLKKYKDIKINGKKAAKLLTKKLINKQ